MGFFTVASNTPGPEASQLQTHRNYGTGRWSVGVQIVRTWRSGSSRLRPLSGHAQTTRSPLMGRKPKSADLLTSRRHLSTNISSLQCHLGGSFLRRTLMFVEGQSQKSLVFLINASRSVLCIIVYSITVCRGVAWPPNFEGYNSRC